MARVHPERLGELRDGGHARVALPGFDQRDGVAVHPRLVRERFLREARFLPSATEVAAEGVERSQGARIIPAQGSGRHTQNGTYTVRYGR